MKVRIKRVFFDENGLHRVGDIAEVKNFDSALMEQIEEPAKDEPKKKTKK